MKFKTNGVRDLFLKDKRKSERLALPIKVSYLLPPAAKWMEADFLDDIGGDGVNFLAPKTIDTGTELDLKITFPQKNFKPITLKGTVIWSAKADFGRCRIGVKFHGMELQDRRRYVKYIAENILLKYLRTEAAYF